jgi:hypothetical protein
VFERDGIVKLENAFTRAEAARMEDAIWRFVERKTGSARSDPTTWEGWRGQPVISFKALKRNTAFAPVYDNRAAVAALDGVFGPNGWREPKPGGQILMTFPNADEWRFPDALWHMDCGFERPTFPTFAVKLFGCIRDMEPGGGATLAIAGSHRLVERYTPGLRPSQFGGGKERWGRFLRHYDLVGTIRDRETHDIDGVPVRLVEMTGAAGDVYLMHLHVFHCTAPNALNVPRMMLGKAVVGRGSEDLELE